MNICNNGTCKIYPDLNTTAPQGPPIYSLNKTEIEAYSPEEIEVCKRDKTIQYNHKSGRYRSDNINGYYWRGFYRRICKWC